MHRTLLPLALLLAGCPAYSGIDPPGDRFFFPTGLALESTGRHLLVANSNFDLRYNAGTVVVVDLDRVDDEIRSCSGACRTPREEADFLLPDHTVVIGSLATDLAVSPDGTRAYATVRGNTTLTWIDVDAAAAGGDRILACSTAAASGNQRCDDRHEVTRSGGLWVPLQPYVVFADLDWVLTGHVESGKVGVFDVADGRPPTLVRLLDSFPTGTNGIARHPVTGAYYLVSRDSDRIYPFFLSSVPRQAGEGPAVTIGPSIRIRSNADGNDSRSLVFAPPRGDLPGGELAFVTNRQPPSVVVVDTAVGLDGVAAGEVIDVIGLSSGPSRLAAQPLPGDGYLVMAICFDTERLFFIDPDLRAVTDVLVTGGGPHALVADPDRRRAYLANFGESTVWVIDLDPASRHFRDVVLSIGTPERPSSND